MRQLSRTVFVAFLGAFALEARDASAYVPDDRWSVTASGVTGQSGAPATLTWSLAPDGSNIPGEGASNLVSYLDGLFGVATTSTDYTKRSWFPLLEESFQRWSELGGVTFVYESHDDGRPLQSTAGSLGVRGDVRLGGSFVDGANGTLAYTWLPDSGDMVVDTGETTFYSNASNNYRQLRNTVMHELGHAIGLLHIESSTDKLLMEPYLDASFDGPQLDDIRGLQALYGDAFEKSYGGLGNGAASRATSLGSLTAGGTLSVGSDARGDQVVAATETDFVSIANSRDDDFFSFSLTAPAILDATLTPLGGVFNQGVEGGAQSSFNANSRNDLSLDIFGLDGSTLLASVDLFGAGSVESLAGITLTSAGTYFARVSGASDNVQLYDLVLSASPMASLLAGDFDGDGVVNSADYTVWRDGLGTAYTRSDYTLWANNFGAVAAAQATSVPEPSSGLLLVIVGRISTACGARCRA